MIFNKNWQVCSCLVSYQTISKQGVLWPSRWTLATLI